jgi:hypothetical protein
MSNPEKSKSNPGIAGARVKLGRATVVSGGPISHQIHASAESAESAELNVFDLQV